MNRITRARALLALTLLLAGTAAKGWAMMALPCAEWLSSGINDEPALWHLEGTETRSQSYTVSGGVIGVTGGVTVTTTWEVGIYTIDGQSMYIDCRTYTRA